MSQVSGATVYPATPANEKRLDTPYNSTEVCAPTHDATGHDTITCVSNPYYHDPNSHASPGEIAVDVGLGLATDGAGPLVEGVAGPALKAAVKGTEGVIDAAKIGAKGEKVLPRAGFRPGPAPNVAQKAANAVARGANAVNDTIDKLPKPVSTVVKAAVGTAVGFTAAQKKAQDAAEHVGDQVHDAIVHGVQTVAHDIQHAISGQP